MVNQPIIPCLTESEVGHGISGRTEWHGTARNARNGGAKTETRNARNGARNARNVRNTAKAIPIGSTSAQIEAYLFGVWKYASMVYVSIHLIIHAHTHTHTKCACTTHTGECPLCLCLCARAAIYMSLMRERRDKRSRKLGFS